MKIRMTGEDIKVVMRDWVELWKCEVRSVHIRNGKLDFCRPP